MEEKLLLGVSRRIITPAVGVPLAGYAPDWFSKSVNDDLTATVFCFEQNGKRTEFYVKDVTINGTRDEFLTDFKKSGVAWSYLRCDVSLIKDNKKAVVKLAQQK